MRAIAPLSCTPVAGLVPPQFTFPRHHYLWLALTLSRCDPTDDSDLSLENVFYGIHTLRWQAMHDIVARALAAGFAVAVPSDIVSAIQSALVWGLGHCDALRCVRADDFEMLPALAPASAGSWWLLTSYATWTVDAMFHPLSQAIGYAGPIWDADSRGPDSRFCLSLLLTQEFISVSASMPVRLYGGPAVQFYLATMLPAQLLVFPSNASRLHNSLTVRWGYHQGTPAQTQTALSAVLPIVLKECPHLVRFLNPTASIAAQVAAYQSIAALLCTTGEGHRYDTIRLVDQRLLRYLHVAELADQLVPIALAEARALLLKDALEAENIARDSAPIADPQGPSGASEGPALRHMITALMAFRSDPDILLLEGRLLRLWTAAEQRPAAVFREVLASRSLTCIAVLFGSLTGVKQAGPIFSVLEQAAADRLKYFTWRLSTPERETQRPDHTLWYSYPLKLDTLVRSPQLEIFSKINLLELGSKIRQLRTKVLVRQQDYVRPGQEFAADTYMYHLSLLNHISPWLEALGFPLSGKAGFDTLLKEFHNFCQHGSHYQGALLDIHVKNMRLLYYGVIEDLHEGFQCFWHRRPEAYNLAMNADQLFPQSGVFYGTMRQCMVDIEKGNDLERFGVIPSAPLHFLSRKRQRAQDWTQGSSHASGSASYAQSPVTNLLHHQSSAPPPAAAELPLLGSWAWSVKEDPNFIHIFEYKFAKALILEKLGLREAEICLPAYLSKKGAAACTHAGQPGHESQGSALHVFSAAALTLRPSLDAEPYRVAGDVRPSHQGSSGKGRGNGGKGRWRSGRFATGNYGRK